jgi:hypothetical protein
MISCWSSWRRTVRPPDPTSLYQNGERVANTTTTESTTDSTKATFDSAASTLRWLGTNGLRMFLQFWYSKQAMFWIPKGWVPYYAEWLLSFPRAPIGSISIQAWFLACTAIIILISDALVAIIALVTSSGVESAQPAKKDPMAVPSKKAGAGEKKDL